MGRRLLVVYLVVSLAFSLLVAVFAIQNAVTVEVRFFGWSVETSLALVLIGTAIVSMLVIGLVAFLRQIGTGLRVMDERSKGQRAAKELEQARLANTEIRREVDRLQEQNRMLVARIRELGAKETTAAAAAAGADGDRAEQPPQGGREERG